MIFDTRTLIYTNVAIFFVLGMALVFIWRTRNTYPGFGLWVTGTFLITLGQLLLGLRGLIPDVFSVLLANLLISSYYILIYEGIRRFLGKDSGWVSLILSLGLILSFVYFTYFDSNVSERLIAVSLFNALVSIFVAFELFKGTPWKLRSIYQFNGTIFLVNCILMILRSFYVTAQPEIVNIYDPNPILAGGGLISISLSILWTFGIIFLTIDRLDQDLKDTQEELQRLSVSDSLTGVYNHRYFFEMGKNEIRQARRYHHALAVIVLDIDNFKTINDTYGHPIGDELLISFVSVCRKCLRESDILGRLGGDEFGMILTNTDLVEGQIVAERLCKAIAEASFSASEHDIHITASIGLTVISDKDEGIDPALQRADKALYIVKNHGRNAVSILSPDAVN